MNLQQIKKEQIENKEGIEDLRERDRRITRLLTEIKTRIELNQKNSDSE